MHELKQKDKKDIFLSALKVLGLVITKGIQDDPNNDISKSSNLPTLILTQLRNLVKQTDVFVPDVVADLIRTVGLIGRSFFNKSTGIEPIFIKGFIPLIPSLMKYGSAATPEQIMLI